MRIAVLGASNSWYLKDLTRAAAGRHEILPIAFRDLASQLDGSNLQVTAGTVDLAELDALLVRSMPPGSLEQVVFRMDVLGRLEARGTVVINPPRAVELAVDKYLATAHLASAGLPVPQTIACQTIDEAMAAFAALGRDVVIKPLFGAEGRGITRIDDDELMLRAAKLLTQLGAVIYLQEFVDHHGYDLRLLVIGPRVLGIRRRNVHDWRVNVSRGGHAEPLEVTDELAEVAHRAATAMGAPLAGVDLLPAKNGVSYAIEVNAVPGWQALSQTLNIDVARCVLELLEECKILARRASEGHEGKRSGDAPRSRVGLV